MTVKLKADILAALAEQKYSLLQEARALVKQQSEFILSNDFDNLAKCLEKTEGIIETLKKINPKLERLQSKMKSYLEDMRYDDVFFEFNSLLEKIAELADTVFQMSVKSREYGEIMLNDIKGQIRKINLNKKGFVSYQKTDHYMDSLYFDQNR